MYLLLISYQVIVSMLGPINKIIQRKLDQYREKQHMIVPI